MDFQHAGRCFAFTEISPRLLPSPTFANWHGEEEVGLSPRMTTRVRMIYTLPLYDSSQVREYVAWHPTPTMFSLQVMDLVQRMSLTHATPHMMANAF